ncbi:MAG: hypothetical protein ACI81P_002955, partial [Neolewinella sp.]
KAVKRRKLFIRRPLANAVGILDAGTGGACPRPYQHKLKAFGAFLYAVLSSYSLTIPYLSAAAE